MTILLLPNNLETKNPAQGCSPCTVQRDYDIKKLLENAISYLQSRFGNFKETPLVCFKIFNFKFWPREQEQLARFGGDDVQCIVDHYKEQLSGDECNKIPQVRMGGTKKFCCAFLRTSIAAGLWRIAKRSPSPISEHSGAGGFDAYTKSKHSRV